MTIDHIGITVSPEKYKTLVDFYLAALKPLGYTQLMTFGPNGEVAGLGADNNADWWITAVPGATDTPNLHVAFSTTDRNVVDAFHSAAVEAGGQDNGAPGLRPHYHENYYAAYVKDPAGNNLEVACRVAPPA